MDKYSLIISIVSFVVSVFTGIITYRYNKITIRNTAILEHNKLLLEIDKILIDDPKLWSIYDDHPLSKDVTIAQDSAIFNAKKEAFIYYYLNLFDAIYEFYHRQIVKNKNDAKQWQAWIQFIRHFLQGCSQARATIKKSYHLYDEDQVCFYKELIDDIEAERIDLSGR